MRSYPTARACSRLTLPFALLALAACSPRIEYRDREVRVVVPGPVQPVPAALVTDCQPAPIRLTTVGAVLDRLDAVSDCLATMRDNAAALRATAP